MSRQRPNRRGFRKPPELNLDDRTPNTRGRLDAAALDRLRALVPLASNEAYFLEIFGNDGETWYVLQVTPDYKGLMPELPETFEGFKVFSEPVGHIILG